MTELMMFGYRARLTIEMPDGTHDVTNCVELIVTPEMAADREARTGFWVNTRRLLDEITVENRTRERILQTAHATAHAPAADGPGQRNRNDRPDYQPPCDGQ